MKTSKITKKHLFISFLVFAIGATSLVVLQKVLAAPPPSQPSFFGAIQTTVSDGQIVNQNKFDSKPEVYLNGGPQNNNANGLPNGVYYFQVTNPSGSVLLSTDDAVCRQVYVVGGRFGGVLPRVSDAVPANLPAVAPFTARRPDACPAHMNGTPDAANGTTPVQLIPFDDTPNNGGEYKVWLIRRATSTTISGRIITFANSNAKTDNFKVRGTDVECIPGVDPECTELTIGGMKYYDANGNGIKDMGEVPVAGVRILVTLSSEPDPILRITDATGNWIVEGIIPGTDYRAEEILPPACEQGSYWVQTGPVADSNGFQGYEGTVAADVTDLDFGDVCFSPGTGGMTLGFWSNKNGERTMSALTGVNTGAYPIAVNPVEPGPGMPGDLYFLRRLNLKGEAMMKKNPVTIDFDPTTYADFKAWILAANAYNMSFMLSGQLAATSLNVRHMKLADSQIVDARGVCNSIGECLGIITIGEVREMADASLGAAGGNVTISGGAHRDSQELMKNFLDKVNNNLLSFASPGPCGVCYIDEQP